MHPSNASLWDTWSTHKKTEVDSTRRNKFTIVTFFRAYIKQLKKKKNRERERDYIVQYKIAIKICAPIKSFTRELYQETIIFGQLVT